MQARAEQSERDRNAWQQRHNDQAAELMQLRAELAAQKQTAAELERAHVAERQKLIKELEQQKHEYGQQLNEKQQRAHAAVQEALRRTPGMTLQEETGSDSLPNVALRGVTNANEGAWRSINLGMYVDGIPLAPAPYGQPGNSLFPLALLCDNGAIVSKAASHRRREAMGVLRLSTG